MRDLKPDALQVIHVLQKELRESFHERISNLDAATLVMSGSRMFCRKLGLVKCNEVADQTYKISLRTYKGKIKWQK